jgi:hypothetical protein
MHLPLRSEELARLKKVRNEISGLGSLVSLYVCENVQYDTGTHKCVWEDVLRGFTRIGISNLVQLHKKFPRRYFISLNTARKERRKNDEEEIDRSSSEASHKMQLCCIAIPSHPANNSLILPTQIIACTIYMQG